MRVVLAHLGGVPVEENLIYVAPVVLVVGFIYLQSWRERRHPERYGDRHDEPDDPSWPEDDGRLWGGDDDGFDALDQREALPHGNTAQRGSASSA